MRILPVLDLAAGVAVHARAGNRAEFAPVTSVLAPGRPGDPLALLRGYRQILGDRECYIADLDAIQGGPVQRNLIRDLTGFTAGFSGALLVDAGASTVGDALEVLACGASQVVVGLETLRAFADLRGIVGAVGAGRSVFSLDLKLGHPLLHPEMHDVPGAMADPVALAMQAAEQGAATVLLIDVGRVGTGCGLDLGLLEALRRRVPDVRLLAGGGVLTRRDLERIRDTGCDGVLIASALHTGRLSAADLDGFTEAPSSRHQSSVSVSR